MKKIIMIMCLAIILIPQLQSNLKAEIAGVNSIVEANNRFTIDFYCSITDKEKGNVFFSPLSIFSAFSMAYEGAQGLTASEIKKALHLPASDNERLSGFSNLYKALENEKNECKLNIANAYWVQKGFPILKSFLEKTERYYKTETNDIDFASAPIQALEVINQWAEKKTQGKIRNLFSQSDIDSRTRIVIASAIYFKGIWQIPFNKEATRLEDFCVNGKRTARVQMMQILDREFPYAETQDFQIIKIPYSQKNLSMLVLLPGEVAKEDNALRDITYEKIKECQKLLVKQKVDVFFPRFKIESTIDLKNALENSGIKTAFNPDLADFSKMTGSKNVFISKAIQKSYIEVNEESTEAAAVTGITMNLTAMKIEKKKVFRANHPFIFFIIEENSGIILFSGKVVNP